MTLDWTDEIYEGLYNEDDVVVSWHCDNGEVVGDTPEADFHIRLHEADSAWFGCLFALDGDGRAQDVLWVDENNLEDARRQVEEYVVRFRLGPEEPDCG